MKILLLLPLFLPTSGTGTHTHAYPWITDTYEVRLAPWPITFKRTISETDTCYYLQFRNQHLLNGVDTKTLEFENLEQLHYFQQGLSVLKKGANGETAEFAHYSIKKVSTNREGIWYILTYGDAITNFQDAQANRLINIIKKL